jgi:hypothetical protein
VQVRVAVFLILQHADIRRSVAVPPGLLRYLASESYGNFGNIRLQFGF